MEEEKKHYVCTGECGGISQEPGICQAPDCPMHGKPLVECSCKMPSHGVEEKTEE
ncbi:hypothetical protein HOF40_03545 [Candidatus Parcubacteria bacterium]|jgi:hypothetical protein|nr:hypothetical protein [Candidatus Parcubacteria bacterium]MBT3949135.1 hypothetical protein [Candidatus Parcubacteria bacterium]